MKCQSLNEKISNLARSADDMSSPAKQTEVLQSALDVVSDVLKILNSSNDAVAAPEEMIENIISANRFKNSKVENWFSVHPIYPDERAALEICETDICQVKFYWLNDNSTKSRISAGVMLTPNWEDRDSTQNDEYKVGIDFFLKKDAKSLLMVVSNRGNLRVMEFSDHLTHTQVEILEKLAGLFALESRKALHTALWNAFALSEVNKKFYEGIARQFTLLCQHLVHNGKAEEDAKLFSSRLLGRLLFIWFLRKKHVIAYEDRYFPKDIGDSTDYYDSILKQLFFKTFNTPIYNRKTIDKTTPYLNGRIILLVRSRSSSVLQLLRISWRFSSLIINASLQPVKIPRFIFISQSFKGTPIRSIFSLILRSIGDRITQLSPRLNVISSVWSAT